MPRRSAKAALAAMEGRFDSGPYAAITLIGQPNVAQRRIDNPLQVPGMLSFLAFGAFHMSVPGLEQFPPDRWPDNIELLYYAFHIMVGLGTLFIAVMAVAAGLYWRGALLSARPVLWVLMLAFPFPYIANTTGWMTAHALFEISTLPALGSCGSVARTTTSPAGTDSKVGNVARASLMTS